MNTTLEPYVVPGKASEEKLMMTDITGEGEVRPGMDIEVESWHREAVKLLDFAGSRRIKSEADLELAADDLAVIVRLKRAMAERRRYYTGPFNDRIKAIEETYRELMAPVEKAEEITRKKMRDCRAARERPCQEALEAE